MSLKSQLKGYARDYGLKAANLILLQSIIQKAKEVGLNAAIPAIEPLSHEVLLAHLNLHFPELSEKWKDFIRLQGEDRSGLTPESKMILNEIRQQILQIFAEHPIDEKLIQDYLANLTENDHLMVRSTGKEDSEDLANPGGNESIAAVQPTPQAISEAIGKVIASYFSEKSLEQRLKGYDDITQPPFLPVLLQKMIGEPLNQDPSEGVVSGVMYTGQFGTKMQMAPGHGELIVNSRAPFDSYYVTREGVVHSQIAIKPERLAPLEINMDGVPKRVLQMVQNDKAHSHQPSVSDSVARRLAEIGQIIEAQYGQPMDVEYVYQPRTDTIYIVQARPIPKGDLKNVIPASIKPEKIKEVRQKAAAITPGQIISPAGERAKIITDPSEILICETIEAALEIYLKQKNSKIKAVVVRNMAPATSHEAAEFNSKAIPVIQVDNLETIESMMTQTNPCVIVDPQRKMVVDWHGQSETADEIIGDGLFKSSMPLQQTVQAVPYSGKNFTTDNTFTLEEQETIGKLFELIEKGTPQQAQAAFNQLAQAFYSLITLPKDTQPIQKLSDMLDVLETIEASTPQTIEASEVALNQILHRLLTLACASSLNVETRQGLNALLQNALATGLEISRLLKEIKTIDQKDFPAYQHSILTLVNRLEAILVYPGHKEVFSSSLVQLLKEEKAIRRAENLAKHKNLAADAKFYFIQFIKMSTLCLNNDLKSQWENFALACAQDKEKRERLAQAIHFLMQNNLGSFMINTLFQNIAKEQPDNFDAIFKGIYVQSAQALKNAKQLGLRQIKEKLDKWQRQEHLWSDPAQFDELFKEFAFDFETIMNRLDYVDIANLGLAEKTLVFNEINRLTTILDNSIKRFKGSTEYTDKDQQAVLFAKMLTPYHRLMERQVKLVSDEQIQSFKSKIDDKYTTKAPILAAIALTFEEKSKDPTPVQLSASRMFSVNSAIITSPASFSRQFIEKTPHLTLEDLFTLFHQNIIAANTILTQDLNLKKEEMPETLQGLMNAVQDYKLIFRDQEYPESLIAARYDYPYFNLQYNLPLAMHAATFNIKYDTVKNSMRFSIQIFGEARSRFDKMSKLADAYLKMLEITVIKAPSKDSEASKEYENKSALEYEFELKADNPMMLEDAAKLVKLMARLSFQDSKFLIGDIVSIVARYPQKAEAIEKQMPLLVNAFLSSNKGVQFSEGDIRAFIELFEKVKLSDKVVEDIGFKIIAKTNATYWMKQEGIQDFISLHILMYKDAAFEKLANAHIGQFTFFETLLKQKNYDLAATLMDNPAFRASAHTKAVSIIAANKDYDFLKRMLEKGLYSELTPSLEEELKTNQSQLHERLQTNKSTTAGEKRPSNPSPTEVKRGPAGRRPPSNRRNIGF